MPGSEKKTAQLLFIGLFQFESSSRCVLIHMGPIVSSLSTVMWVPVSFFLYLVSNICFWNQAHRIRYMFSNSATPGHKVMI